jgi:hypothetical protein
MYSYGYEAPKDFTSQQLQDESDVLNNWSFEVRSNHGPEEKKIPMVAGSLALKKGQLANLTEVMESFHSCVDTVQHLPKKKEQPLPPHLCTPDFLSLQETFDSFTHSLTHGFFGLMSLTPPLSHVSHSPS